MKMKAIASVLFLIFISIIGLRTNVIKANKLNVGPGKPVSQSVMMTATFEGVW